MLGAVVVCLVAALALGNQTWWILDLQRQRDEALRKGGVAESNALQAAAEGEEALSQRDAARAMVRAMGRARAVSENASKSAIAESMRLQDAAYLERDGANRARDSAIEEAGLARKAASRERAERDEEITERRAAQKKRVAARKERDAARKERDAARKERDAARKERDAAREELEQTKKALKSFRRQRDSEHRKLDRARHTVEYFRQRQGLVCGLPAAYRYGNKSKEEVVADEWRINCDKPLNPGGLNAVCQNRDNATAPTGNVTIPLHIAQTGPPDKSKWPEQFKNAFGSWQKRHPKWEYEFWNDTQALNSSNPNFEPFVKEHFPWFLPAWQRLCTFVMRLDVARYMWLYVRGGVYADLDVKATKDMTQWLRGADVVLPANSRHADELGCWRRTRYEHMSTGRCGAHLGNWWMASIPRHELWLDMLTYVSENVETMCERKTPRGGGAAMRAWNILELTGPYALGRVVLNHLQRTPNSRIAFVKLDLPFAISSSAASWRKSPPPPRPPSPPPRPPSPPPPPPPPPSPFLPPPHLRPPPLRSPTLPLNATRNDPGNGVTAGLFKSTTIAEPSSKRNSILQRQFSQPAPPNATSNDVNITESYS